MDELCGKDRPGRDELRLRILTPPRNSRVDGLIPPHVDRKSNESSFFAPARPGADPLARLETSPVCLSWPFLLSSLLASSSGAGAAERGGAWKKMSGPSPLDPYAALELKPGASDEEVKAAFRRLAHVYHPDKASSAAGRAEARFNFNRITAARNRLLGDGGPGGQTRGWTAHNTGMSAAHMGNARRAGRISNAAFAAVLALPLCLIGVVSNWAFPSEQSRLVAGTGVGGGEGHMGRVNGFLEPPVNPWLRDDVVEEGRRRGMHRKSVYERVGARMFSLAGGGKESAAADATRGG